MTPALLEKVLKDLPRYGTLVKDYPYRKIWRVNAEGEEFFLKFYPSKQNRWRRLLRGSAAMREFIRLQWLEKAKVPSARAHSVLMGLSINGQKGDAVLIESIRDANSLLEMAQEAHLQGRPIRGHRSLVLQVLAILQRLGEAGLGHTDLHLGNFLVKEGKVFLIDLSALDVAYRVISLIVLGLLLLASAWLWQRLQPGPPSVEGEDAAGTPPRAHGIFHRHGHA